MIALIWLVLIGKIADATRINKATGNASASNPNTVPQWDETLIEIPEKKTTNYWWAMNNKNIEIR